jgi:NADH:ubiquinone oxidoreductase subunit F (NADH-binding)
MSAMTLDEHRQLESRLLSVPMGPPLASPLATHIAAHGTLTIPKNDDLWNAAVERAVRQSGLLGRGGAGFPTWAKWAALSQSKRRPVVVVNGIEGEPASAKDRVLLTHAPHLALDGAEVAASVIGAREIVFCVADSAAADSVEEAIEERRHAGMGRARAMVRRAPGRYVAGEESALVTWLQTGAALPVMRRDKSVPLTVGRRPAVVHNVETLSQVALIARHGPAWFRALGTPEAPGTTLVTVSGAVRRPGVLEIPLGTPIIDILAAAGLIGPAAGVLVGGYGGTWLAASRSHTPYAPGPLSALGATHGVGVLIALPQGSCGIAETARIARYMAGQSAGQCGPCVFGLPAIADDLEQLWSGRAEASVVDRIGHRAATVDGRGACRHPDGVARVVRSALNVFAEDARAHAQGRPCAGAGSPTVLPLPSGQGRPIRRTS